MTSPYYQDDDCTIYHGDCLEIMPELEPVDLMLTDPPYPDQYPEYGDINLLFLNDFGCKQFIFWSAKAEFPLSYTAIHIWDKKTGCASQYERIFERNSKNKNWAVYNYYLINSTVAASYAQDIFWEHPSQKPIKLIKRLFADRANIILDPFMGSGTTLVAAKQLNRKAIGIEIEEKYCEMAAKRVEREDRLKRKSFRLLDHKEPTKKRKGLLL